VYHASARPVEDFFREHGVLREFYIAGGIPETMPRLMAELAPFRRCLVRVQTFLTDQNQM